MGRRVQSIVPQAKKLSFPKWAYMDEFQEANMKFKNQQKRNIDERHRGLDLPEIPNDTNVWITLGNLQDREGLVTSSHQSPRPYIVDTPVGSVRCNRSQLNVIPSTNTSSNKWTSSPTSEDNYSSQRVQEPARRIMTRSQTGTPIYPSDGFKEGDVA